MSKRRRVEDVIPGPRLAATTKPLSAVAAARLRAEAKAKGIVTPEITSEPVPEASIIPPSSLPHESEDLGSDEEPFIRQNVKLCNWRNEPRNILLETKSELTIKINKHTTVALIGCFRFKVLRGAVNINGANIAALSRDSQKDQEYTSYVPATHPISKIRGLDTTNHMHFVSCEGPRPLVSTSPLFADIWNVRTESESSRSFSIIAESDADPLLRPLSAEASPEDWLRAVEDCATDPSIVITIGPSATGKSTFARRLLNRFLTGQGRSARPVPAVCYLDLDPEKPEYTPPGQVSLVVVESLNLGPNFTHPVTPSSSLGKKANKTIRSHCVPTNLANYRDYYRSCAEDLFLAYKALQSQDLLLPLVVNTPGSLYSSDIDLLTGLLTRFKPHHTVHLSDTRAIDTDIATKLHSLEIIVSQYRGTIHEITAQSPAPLPMRTNLELKAMQMQSYFHLMKTKSSEPGISKWTPSPTSNLLPWEFCYEETDERRQDFVGFAMYSEPVEPASLVQSLNGSIVQIVESTSSAIPTPYVALPRTSNYRVPYFEKSTRTGMVEPLDPKTSNLLCTALVRGFDPEKRVVQLLVPNTHESMLYNLSPERTVLVGGCCETPEWAYLEELYATNGAIYAESVLDNTSCMPWVEEKARMDEMGYLNTVRRVRKFQT